MLSMLQSQHKDFVVLYNTCLLLLESGLIDHPAPLLVMNTCCLEESKIADDDIGRKTASGMRVVGFLLAAKVSFQVFLNSSDDDDWVCAVGIALLQNRGGCELFGQRVGGSQDFGCGKKQQ